MALVHYPTRMFEDNLREGLGRVWEGSGNPQYQPQREPMLKLPSLVASLCLPNSLEPPALILQPLIVSMADYQFDDPSIPNPLR